MKMSKSLNIFLIISIIVIIAFLIVCILLQLNRVSREEVLETLQKAQKLDNVSCFYTSTINNIQKQASFFLKDNLFLMKTDELLYWKDLSTHETIFINYETKVAKVKTEAEDTLFSLWLDDYLKYFQEDSSYIFKDASKQDGKIIAEVQSPNEGNSIFTITIDEQTGIPEQLETSDGLVIKRTIQLDVVTDEMIQKPDLTGYSIVQE